MILERSENERFRHRSWKMQRSGIKRNFVWDSAAVDVEEPAVIIIRESLTYFSPALREGVSLDLSEMEKQ